MTVDPDAKSTILVPVPEATELIRHYRLDFDPSAGRGMPEHVTLLYPFLSPPAIGADHLSLLRALFAGVSPFSFALPAVARFDDRVLYLAPQPREPFVTLTQRIADEFGLLPYEGRYQTINPHVTIAQNAGEETFKDITHTVSSELPIQAIAGEAWLMVRTGTSEWRIQEQFPFPGTS